MRTTLTLVLIACPLTAAWNCVSEGNREVCVDGSARRAQTVLDELRILESAWSAKNGALPALSPPLRLMLYRSRNEFLPFQSMATNLGLYQSAADRDWLLVLDSGEGAIRAARHEWVHRAHHHTTPALPVWLEEGLAEYWSTLEGGNGQSRLGKPLPDHLRLLNQTPWLSAAELSAVNKQSDHYRQDRLAALFYAQSWALVHSLGQHPDWKGKLEAFAATVAAGGAREEAFHQTWGRSMDQALDQARAWVRLGAPGSESIPLPATPAEGGRPARTLTDTEATVLKAEALLACSRTSEAQVLLEDAGRRGYQGPELWSARAYISLQSGDKAAALRLFEDAIARGDRRGAVLLERAMLLRETGSPAPQVKAALQDAVGASPGLAEGWHLLSNMLAAERDASGAVAAAEKAAAILPRQSVFWESLGRAYLASARPIEAGAAAAKAALSAQNDIERQLANGLKRDVAAWRPPEPPKAAKSWFQVPDGWQGPKPDAGINGRLVEVTCGTDLLLFTVETAPKQRTILRAADPSKIFLRQQDGEKREFVCGPQKPVLLVEAGYRSDPEPKAKSAGELIVLAIQGIEQPAPPAPARKKPQPAKPQPTRKAPSKKPATSKK